MGDEEEEKGHKLRYWVSWVGGLAILTVWGMALVRECVNAFDWSNGKPSPPYPLEPREIPFPAITVCPAFKIRSVFDRDDKYAEEVLQMLCPLGDIGKSNTSKIFKGPIEMIEKIALPLEKVFGKCYWENESVNCTSVFRKIITSEGVCFTFNALWEEDLNTSSGYWVTEGGYPNSKTEYPRRLGGTKGLKVTLLTSPSDPSCGGNLGHRVYINHPNDIPMIGEEYVLATIGMKTTINIEPELKIEMHQRTYSSIGRKCYSLDEYSLDHYTEYTKTKCREFCFIKEAQKNCGCLPFWLYEKNVPICGPGMKLCLNNIPKIMALAEKEFEGCFCYPECWSLTYRKTKINQVPLNITEKILQGNPNLTNIPEYSSVQIIPTKTTEVMPKSLIEINIEEYGSTGSVLFISGICLSLYLILMVIVSNQERISNANETEMKSPLTSHHDEEEEEEEPSVLVH